jgi:hypothetical protein
MAACIPLQQITLQKGCDFRPVNSTKLNYYIRILGDVPNVSPQNLIVRINETKFVVNKTDNFVLTPNSVNNNVIFNLPAQTKYCITDATIDATCMAKMTDNNDDYYCDTTNANVLLPRGTVIYDISGNKFIVDSEIKNCKLC